MTSIGDPVFYSFCEFLLILPVAVEVEPGLVVKDQGLVLTRFPNHTASPEPPAPFLRFRKNDTFPRLRSGKGLLRRKVKADMAFSRHSAHKRSGQHEFVGRSFGDLSHEFRKVKIQRRKEAALLERIQVRNHSYNPQCL